jgi:3-deoxy-D-manno-octulosonic-acid transferase
MRIALRGLYQLAAAAALLVAGPFLLVRRGRHYLPTLSGRLGRNPPGAPQSPQSPPPLWIHAVSVGEVAVAATLARALPSRVPLLVTTVTPTGQERARALFRERAATTDIAYLPFDLGFAVRRFFDRFHPAALVLVEGDFWPLVLSEARRRSLPVAVVNGRVGDRSFSRMKPLRPLLRFLFSGIERFGAQSAQDRNRLAALGIPAERITVTGNLKYESPEPSVNPELEERMREIAGGRPILLAGSTMAGEEAVVLDAFRRLGGGEKALLVLAPRHPERWEVVWGILGGMAAARRSALTPRPLLPLHPSTPSPGEGEISRTDVVLLDSLGELAGLYRISAGAFIGGTLVPTGGHNPLEPARFGVPMAVGPSMYNFRDMAGQFDRARAWRRVADAGELAAAWGEWIGDPDAAREQGERGRRLLEENRGALARTIEMLNPILSTHWQ